MMYLGTEFWDNCLTPDEIFAIYKLVRKLTRCSSYCGRKIGREFLLSIGSYNISTTLEQLYTEFGIIPMEACSYHGHLEKIKEFFGLDRHIVDISCG